MSLVASRVDALTVTAPGGRVSAAPRASEIVAVNRDKPSAPAAAIVAGAGGLGNLVGGYQPYRSQGLVEPATRYVDGPLERFTRLVPAAISRVGVSEMAGDGTSDKADHLILLDGDPYDIVWPELRGGATLFHLQLIANALSDRDIVETLLSLHSD
ncbi:MAG: hypothetical protein M1833_007284 [Piccolia ochrophora]|nr:MAG: hypothetical protein M1833_007284 [Piccolia ochrophora]